MPSINMNEEQTHVYELARLLIHYTDLSSKSVCLDRDSSLRNIDQLATQLVTYLHFFLFHFLIFLWQIGYRKDKSQVDERSHSFLSFVSSTSSSLSLFLSLLSSLCLSFSLPLLSPPPSLPHPHTHTHTCICLHTHTPGNQILPVMSTRN